MKIVIVGGVAGGASVAARLRRMQEDAEIILLERGDHISFANCGLPYHIGGVIPQRDSLLLLTPEEFKQYFTVDARVRNEVISIDRQRKTVTIKDWRRDQLYTETYDKLVLSPGASPIHPPVPGADLEGIFTLRNLADMDAIKTYITAKRPARAVVIGGGFIGIELAENLHHRGIQVTVVEMMNQVMAPIDFDMAALVHHHLDFKHVRLALGDGLSAIAKQDEGLRVTLQSGKTVDAEMIIMSIGVRPENMLAKEAGLELGQRGTIATNEFLQTNDPDIYALGDAAEVTHLVSGQRTSLPLAGPASKQGRIVADHISGRKLPYKGVLGTSVVKVFDLTVASTGMNSRQLEQAGIPFESAIIHASNHAGYYPNATPLTIKLLYAKDGKVLGAQAVGVEGIDKRIDVVATAMHSGATVYDLEELELSYAPPYGSSRDPINVVGFLAANTLRGDVKLITWDKIDSLDHQRNFLVDVRDPVELDLGKIPGAVNIPWAEIRSRMNELPRDKTIVIFCQVGKRGYFVARILAQHGFDVVNLSGGYKTYFHAVTPQSNFDTYEYVTISKTEEIVELAPESRGTGGKEIIVDACGLQCPGPIMKLSQTMKEAKTGDVVTITATDFGFFSDSKAWANRTGNKLLSVEQKGNTIVAQIQKGLPREERSQTTASTSGKTIVVFSGDLDKALASFIIANGAASMGHKVTMFFTFWGLNILRKPEKVNVKKNLIEKMFGFMMPRGATKAILSNMHMAGAGTAMIKGIMKKKNVDMLPLMIQKAQESGVVLQACLMSMDLMGIKQEELLDGVELAGVATMIASSDESNATLFI